MKISLGAMSTTGAGILGAIGGAGLTYALAKRKINQLEAEIKALKQQSAFLQFNNQQLQNEIVAKNHVIAEKDQELRQKDEQIAIRDAEIHKLKEERKRALNS